MDKTESMFPILKKLNILLSYPVKWTVDKILRDFIQNFFDAVGPQYFGESFRYMYSESVLQMYVNGSFDKEWLYYIGASTKRSDGENYAGRFGEGFKLASLTAYRDYHFRIKMESKDWILIVTEAQDQIDGKDAKCLAYELSQRTDDGRSVLTLSNVSEEQYAVFRKTINDFYYEGNPRIGKCIASRRGYSIFSCPESSPDDGAIFVDYQLRFAMKGYPFIVLNLNYRPDDDDRDRPRLRRFEAEDCVMEVIRILDPQEAYTLLLLLKKYWGKSMRKLCFSLIPVIEELVRILRWNEIICRSFKESFKNEIVADFRRNVPANRKLIAKEWFSRWAYRSRKQVVLNCFSSLGIDDIETLCEKNNGFTLVRDPTQKEFFYIAVLEELAREYFSDIISYDTLPFCHIIINDSCPFVGEANCISISNAEPNGKGLTPKQEILYITIRQSLLHSERFSTAVATYLHELLHQFGDDRDKQFHSALLEMDLRLMMLGKQLDQYEKKWKSSAINPATI